MVKTVTVIVPAFNAGETIAACIESLLGQSRQPDEIIIVDDGSRDDTVAVASKYAIKVIRLATNSGPGVARNAGAAAARGEILAFTDADCVAPPYWLERIVGAVDGPGLVAATGGYAGPVRDTFLTRLQYLILRRRQAASPAEIESTITSNFACVKSAFEAVGGFPLYARRSDPGRPIWGNEDEELGFLLIRRGGKIRWMADVGVLHRFRPDLHGYLRQQRFYAERIILSHFRFPEMARSHTNYSRLSGALHLGPILGVGLGLLSIMARAFGLATMEWGVVLLLVAFPVYLIVPLPTLLDFRRGGESTKFLAKSYPVLLAVDVAWLFGALWATFLRFGGFIDGVGESGGPPAAPGQ